MENKCIGKIIIAIDGFIISNDMFGYQIMETDNYILYSDTYDPNNEFLIITSPEYQSPEDFNVTEYLKQFQYPYHRNVKYIGYLQNDNRYYPVYAMPDYKHISWFYSGDKAYNILKLYLSKDGYNECECNNVAFSNGEKTIIAKDNFSVGINSNRELVLDGYYYLDNNDPQLPGLKERPFHAERFIHRRLASLTNIE